jgi:tetratricopeptide (TPR) repeat protein
MIGFLKKVLSSVVFDRAAAVLGLTGFRTWAGRERSRRGRQQLLRGAELAKAGKYLAASAAFLAAIELAPENAEAYHGRGVCLMSLGEFEAARDSFIEARDLAPMRDDIRNRLGLALRRLNELDGTIESFKRALVLTPGSGEALNNLADVFQARDREDDAFTGFARALAVMPTSAGVYCNLGCAYRDAGLLEEAAASFELALALEPLHPGAHFNRGTLALLQGDFAKGWAGYEWRGRAEGFVPSAAYTASQWRGEEIAGKLIYVHSEQGLGDILQFVRFIPELSLRCEKVVLRVPEALRRAISGMAAHAEIIGPLEATPYFDLHSPLLSLPLAFGTDEASIPATDAYLVAEPDLRRKWRDILASPHALRVGLVWASGARSSTSVRRSIDLNHLAEILADARIRWVSLQLPPQSEQAARFPGETSLDLSALQPNMADTAAIIMELDLVITVDTSIAHLAGALGRPVWVMLPHGPDWRWQLNRTDSPWYESMRLFRQSGAGDWASVAAALKAALELRLAEKGAVSSAANQDGGVRMS